MKNNTYQSFILVVLMFLASASGIAAQMQEPDLLNQLYHEIVNSTPGGSGTDSMQPEFIHQKNPDAGSSRPDRVAADRTAEKLTREIESMVREANERHDEAVKFMLDAK